MTQNLSYAFYPQGGAVSSRDAGSQTPTAPKYNIYDHVKTLNTLELNNKR